MNLQENLHLAWRLIPIELWNTIYMVTVSTFLGWLIGLPLGIFLILTKERGLKQNLKVYSLLGTVVDIGRAIPFAILMVALIPFTRWIIGTSIGTTAAIVPLAIATAPFVARLVEGALTEVDSSLVEAATVMGAYPRQVITKVLIPEALPSLISGLTLSLINVIAYSAMAGFVGGGGLGKIAIQYGYQRFNGFLMLLTLVLLLLLVGCVQWIGNKAREKIERRRGK